MDCVKRMRTVSFSLHFISSTQSQVNLGVGGDKLLHHLQLKILKVVIGTFNALCYHYAVSVDCTM